MLKSTIAAAILASVTSLAFAQTGGAAATSAGATEGASQNNVAPYEAKTTKHAKSKKMTKASTATGASGSAGSGTVTGATGTTAPGTAGETTSGATKPASDTMKH